MKYGTVPGINKQVARLVQGTIGFDTSDREGSFKLFDTAYKYGFNTYDTAHVYGEQREKMMGAWIKDRGVREEVVILGKGAHHSDRPRVTPEDITSDLDESLTRLGTDYIDLYVLHRDDPLYPVGPIVESLNAHRRAGKIHSFGGSNWSSQRIAEANAYAAEHDLMPFSVSSPNYSLAEQVVEPWANCVSISSEQGYDSREWYRHHDVALFTWSSLAGGFFSGRFQRDNLDSIPESDGLGRLCIRSYAYEQNFQRLDRVTVLADEKGVTVPQIALAFVMNQPMNIFALIYCANEKQFADNAAALNLSLTQQELDWLDLKAHSLI